MKKKVLATTCVLALAGALLTANAAAGSSFLNNMVKAEGNAYHNSGSESIIPISLEGTVKEKNSPASVPNLTTEPEISEDTLYEYLSKVVTPEETQLYYNWADNSHNAKSLETRELTDEESKRAFILRDQYDYDGLRPESPLPLVPGDYDFYFDIENDTYHYPDRAMTDEEILQWIDLGARLNYALGLRYDLLYADQNPQPSSKDITEEEALDKAKINLKKLFDFDLDKSSLSVSISFSTVGPAERGEWHIFLAPYKMNTLLANGETYWTYNVSVDSLTGDVTDTSGRCSTYERTPLTADTRNAVSEDNSWVETARAILTEKLGETRKINNIFVDNKYYGGRIADGAAPENIKWVEEKSNEAGMVFVIAKLDDGSKYTVTLFNPDQALGGVSYNNNLLGNVAK